MKILKSGSRLKEISERILQIEHEIKEIEEQVHMEKQARIAEINEATTLDKFGINLQEAMLLAREDKEGMNPFLSSIRIKPPESEFLVLTQKDKKIIESSQQWDGSISCEDLVLIHKTRFPPKDNKIKTAKSAGAIDEYEYYWGGDKCDDLSPEYIEANREHVDQTTREMKERVNQSEKGVVEGETLGRKRNLYRIDIPSSRDTVHFAVNGEVTEHNTGNAWDSYEYAIIIPFTDILKLHREGKIEIGSAAPMDTFIVGDVPLTENSWIVCPEGEGRDIKANNSKLNIIEYALEEGEKARGYAETVCSALGYSIEDIEPWSWRNKDKNKVYEKLMEDNGFLTKAHSATLYGKYEEMMCYVGKICGRMRLLQNRSVIKSPEDELQIRESACGRMESFIEIYGGDSLIAGLAEMGLEVPDNIRNLKEITREDMINIIYNVTIPTPVAVRTQEPEKVIEQTQISERKRTRLRGSRTIKNNYNL